MGTDIAQMKTGLDISPQAIVGRVRALVLALRQRAEQTEALRRLPDETVRDFRAGGLFRILQPRQFGGAEADAQVLVDIAREAGQGCGSSGWCLSLLAVHNWLVSLYPPEAQHEVLGRNPDALVATSLAPQGKATPVAGGYRLSGQWQFASGCDHAQWIAVGGVVTHPTPPPAPDMRLFLVPQGAYRIDDTWFVAGLRGTGSKDLIVEDVFIPAHRVLSIADAQAGNTPGAAARDTPLYRIPLTALFIMAAAGPALGIAAGALTTYCEWVQTRTVGYTELKKAGQAAVQMRLAEAAVEIDAVELLLRRDCEAMMQTVRANDPFSLHQRAQYRRDAVYAVTVCTRAVDRLFAVSGGNALYDRHPLQRAFRDIHALASHAFLNPDLAAELYGQVALGLEPNGLI